MSANELESHLISLFDLVGSYNKRPAGIIATLAFLYLFTDYY